MGSTTMFGGGVAIAIRVAAATLLPLPCIFPIQAHAQGLPTPDEAVLSGFAWRYVGPAIAVSALSGLSEEASREPAVLFPEVIGEFDGGPSTIGSLTGPNDSAVEIPERGSGLSPRSPRAFPR